MRILPLCFNCCTIEGGQTAVAIDQSVEHSFTRSLQQSALSLTRFKFQPGHQVVGKKSYLRLLWANVEIKLHFGEKLLHNRWRVMLFSLKWACDDWQGSNSIVPLFYSHCVFTSSQLFIESVPKCQMKKPQRKKMEALHEKKAAMERNCCRYRLWSKKLRAELLLGPFIRAFLAPFSHSGRKMPTRCNICATTHSMELSFVLNTHSFYRSICS